jgi:long-subunit fatty acid transport protein
MRRVLSLLLVVGGVLMFVPSAEAGGFDFPSLGTKPLGRGGAYAARADDPLALLYNPANLAGGAGNQLLLNVSMAFLDSCYTRYSDPTNTVGDVTRGSNGSAFDDADFSSVQWPTVCNDAIPTIMPTLVFSSRLSPELGIGGGLLVPSAIGFSSYGDPSDATVRSGGVDVPAPNRYGLLESKIILLQPTIGVGYAPHPMIRFGASVQWGLAFVDFLNHTVVAGTEDTESTGSDVRTQLTTSDLFVPGFNVSAHVVPHDNLDVMLAFRWQDAVKAGGHINFETGTYGNGSATEDGPVPTKTKVNDVTFEAPLPWTATFGIRYADRIAPRPHDPSEVERLSGRVEDSMSNEWWDIELNAVYTHSSSMDEYRIGLPTGSSVDIRNSSNGTVSTVMSPVPTLNRVPHNWRDQLMLNLGGDYNVLPGLAAVRLGVSYETSGVNRSYMQLDYWPVQTFGVHGGLTVRLGRFDISLAYAHFFRQSVYVSPAEAKLPQLVAVGTPSRMNAGAYESDMDVVSLGVTWHL